MFYIEKFLLQTFALEGFVKACPVGLTDFYRIYSYKKYFKIYMTPYSVLPSRCGAQESLRALFI